MTWIIKNAVIVNEHGLASRPQDILVEKDRIARIAAGISPENRKVFDARGKLVFPGFIDLHAHLRQPGQEHKETLETGMAAAAKGGFTTILCMPNTEPVIDSRMVVEGVLEEAQRVGTINVFPIGAITRGQRGEDMTDIFELKEAGCLALSDDGHSVANTQIMRHAVEYARMAGILVMEHCEDPHLICGGVMNEGSCSTLLGLKGLPGMSETIIIGRDIELARYLKTNIHFCHVSLKRSVDLIREAKKNGIAVSAEACPHHFSLTEDALKDFDTNAKVNPPLRTKEDVEALKQGLKDGTIDCIATDHAPHALEEKELDFDHAPFGMIGLETALGLAAAELVAAGIIDWPRLAGLMSAAPARLIGLKNKGVIEEGKDADFTVIDPEREWVFRKEDIASMSKNSPFIGRTFKGMVAATVCRGRVVYKAPEI